MVVRMHIRRILVFIVVFLGALSTAHAAIVYQNFETDNGTPAAYGAAKSAQAEYGWGFNGTAVGLNDGEDPVHGGAKSWKMTIPAGEHVHAGSAVAAQVQTYMVDFVPECHDRLTFWIWAEPSSAGDHTAMVKFFDQGKYKQEGIGVWTQETARHHQWTKLTILFSQLPADFNLRRVDKIEFFNYWDGTYYFDDIEIRSSNSVEADQACLKKENYLSCLDVQKEGIITGETPPAAPLAQWRALNPVLAASLEKTAFCFSVFSDGADAILGRSRIFARRRLEGLELLEKL